MVQIKVFADVEDVAYIQAVAPLSVCNGNVTFIVGKRIERLGTETTRSTIKVPFVVSSVVTDADGGVNVSVNMVGPRSCRHIVSR